MLPATGFNHTSCLPSFFLWGNVIAMETDGQDRKLHRHLFVLGCVVEGALLVLGAMVSWLLGHGLLGNFHCDKRDALIGLVATVPPLGMFFWAFHSRWEPLRQIRRVLEELVRPKVHSWSVAQLLLLACLAGLGEEFFFRGALQNGLAILVGQLPALILASLIFGCFHPMTWGYLLLTSLIGCYLGGLWLWTGNLLVPVLIHALYDFVALLYFLKRGRGGANIS